jgi:hypothetical protein
MSANTGFVVGWTFDGNCWVLAIEASTAWRSAIRRQCSGKVRSHELPLVHALLGTRTRIVPGQLNLEVAKMNEAKGAILMSFNLLATWWPFLA